MINLEYFWASGIHKVSPLRRKPLFYAFSIYEICFGYYRGRLKMILMEKKSTFSIFQKFSLCFTWNSSQKMTVVCDDEDDLQNSWKKISILPTWMGHGKSINIYYSSVFSHLSYGVEAWGSACDSYISHLEVVQNKAVRIISGVQYYQIYDEDPVALQSSTPL